MERFKVGIAVFAILTKEKEVLLLKRKNTGYQDGKYGLPSGHLEPDEFPIKCIEREVMEELGVKVNNINYSSTIFNTTETPYVNLFFTGDILGEPKNCEPDKCDDMRWFNLEALPDNLTPEVRQALENYKQNKYYSEI